MPGQRQRDESVVNLRGVYDYVLSESALISLLLLDAGREDSPPVPVAVLVLPQVDDGMLGFEVTEQNAAVEQVARVVFDPNPPQGEEQGIFGIADLDGVDRPAIEEAARHVADV